MTDKTPIIAQIHQHLERVASLREQQLAHPDDARDRARLRQWQADRLGRTHQDLLASRRYGPAARFFLTDLYGPEDASRREADLIRLLPMAEKILPESGLVVLARAIELDALSEDLDVAMIAALRRLGAMEAITAEAYLAAYQFVGQASVREHQIALITTLGETLDRLAHKPFLGTTLRLVAGPAQLAGLGELHAFVERGYRVCRQMGDAEAFLEEVAERERAVMQALFAGDISVLQ